VKTYVAARDLQDAIQEHTLWSTVPTDSDAETCQLAIDDLGDKLQVILDECLKIGETALDRTNPTQDAYYMPRTDYKHMGKLIETKSKATALLMQYRPKPDPTKADEMPDTQLEEEEEQITEEEPDADPPPQIEEGIPKEEQITEPPPTRGYNTSPEMHSRTI
jgi:hypothetical protein